MSTVAAQHGTAMAAKVLEMLEQWAADEAYAWSMEVDGTDAMAEERAGEILSAAFDVLREQIS